MKRFLAAFGILGIVSSGLVSPASAAGVLLPRLPEIEVLEYSEEYWRAPLDSGRSSPKRRIDGGGIGYLHVVSVALRIGGRDGQVIRRVFVDIELPGQDAQVPLQCGASWVWEGYGIDEHGTPFRFRVDPDEYTSVTYDDDGDEEYDDSVTKFGKWEKLKGAPEQRW